MSAHASSDGPPSAAVRAAFPEWQLLSGDYRAVISAVGATVRELTYRGRDLVVPFDAAQVRPFYRGALIAPWPNRRIVVHVTILAYRPVRTSCTHEPTAGERGRAKLTVPSIGTRGTADEPARRHGGARLARACTV